MIRHILKMLWNEKSRFYSILTEQVIVFIILMIATVSVAITIHKYLSPGILDTDDVVSCHYTSPQEIDYEKYSFMVKATNSVVENMKKKPYVKAITRGLLMVPYFRSVDDPNSNPSDSITVDNQKFIGYIVFSDEFGDDVFHPHLIAGAWFDGEEELENGNRPLVITQQFAENAKLINPVGKTVYFQNYPYQIIGVIDGLKHGALTASTPKVIFYQPSYVLQNYSEICVRLKPGHKEMFMFDYCKEFKHVFGEEIQPYLFDLSQTKQINMFPTTSKLFLQLIPTLFLFIFTFLGTLGLFWMYSKRRIQEFGLRLAIGSTNRELVEMIVAESVLLTMAACVPGIVLAFFIYPIDGLHILAIAVTLFVMLLFSVISAWYPAYRVAGMNPAESLHYE